MGDVEDLETSDGSSTLSSLSFSSAGVAPLDPFAFSPSIRFSDTCSSLPAVATPAAAPVGAEAGDSPRSQALSCSMILPISTRLLFRCFEAMNSIPATVTAAGTESAVSVCGLVRGLGKERTEEGGDGDAAEDYAGDPTSWWVLPARTEHVSLR